MELELVYSPNWFYGKDIVIDIVSVLVLFLIAYFSIKYYKIDKKNKNYLLFAGSFVTLALSFLFKIITNFSLHNEVIKTAKIGSATVIYQTVQISDILFRIGFLLHMILMILGLFMLYRIYTKTRLSDTIIIIYLILISTYFSESMYFVFHLTCLFFLVMITLQYWHNYKKMRHDTNRWLLYSFSLITLSQVIFVFIGLHTSFYVGAEIIQLLGYTALLMTFIKVLMDGKKKRKD